MLNPGQILDSKYEIIKILGRGGMGTVYLCKNNRLGNLWAVKEVNTQCKNEINFLAEPNILKNLSHIGIVRIIDIFYENDNLYIVEDYIEGKTLKEYVSTNGVLSSELVTDIALQLCSILGYLHSFNPPIVYRDLKPSNIIIKPNNKVVLIDFGIARSYKEGQEGDTMILGSIGYIAPEQLVNVQSNAQTDIYSLGTTMFFMLTGKPIILAADIMHEKNYPENTAKSLIKVIQKASATDPKSRYSDTKLMRPELNAIIVDREYTRTMFMNSQESAAEVTKTVLVGTKKPKKTIILLMIALSACIIALAVFLTSFMSNKASVKKASETVPKTAETTKPKKIVKKEARTAAVNLGAAGNYAILSKSQISTVPNSVITGNIGVSPINSTAITGFSLTVDATNEFLCSTQINGKVYASDYDSSTSSNLTTAISNMETAYTDAAGRAVNYTELYTGDISGQTLTAGVYKWGTDVLINSDVTLHGGADDVWIFQIAKGITQANDTKIILTGGAQAKNIFWQSSETVDIGTNAHLEGIILGKTNITMGSNASINGRLLAQTAVTLIKSTVAAP